jgi:hypothetical protein
MDILIGGSKILAMTPAASLSTRDCPSTSSTPCGDATAMQQVIALLATMGDDSIQTINMNGSVVLPGIIDPHVHVTGGGGEKGPASRVPPAQLSQIVDGMNSVCVCVCVYNCASVNVSLTRKIALTTCLVVAGVTTLVGLLGTDSVTRSLENLLQTLMGLDANGLTTYMFTGSYHVPVVTILPTIEKYACNRCRAASATKH